MSSQGTHQISPPLVPASPPLTGGVRRHHTISASSRTARAGARAPICEETQEQQLWNDDEPVDEDWVGGVGAVGEKTVSLHRQSSLPTKYKTFHGQKSSRQAGNLTPRTMNSLSAIAGHEGDEEDWESDMRGFQNDDEHDMSNSESAQHQHVVDTQSQSSTGNPSPLSPQYPTSHVPSPPPAGSGVRRHQSLTYGAQSGVRQMTSSGLKRAGTVQGSGRHPSVGHSPSPPHGEEEYIEEQELINPYEDESYFSASRSPAPAQQQQQYAGQGQYPTSPMGRSSPWNAPGTGEWRTPGGSFSVAGTGNPDELARALSGLEINNNIYVSNMGYQAGQSAHPPRFQPTHPPPALSPGARSGNLQGAGNGSRKLQLNTELDGRKTPTAQPGPVPGSVPAYAQSIGAQQQMHQSRAGSMNDAERAMATGATSWEQKERLGQRTSNPNLNYRYNQGQKGNIPNVPSIPSQYLNQQSGQAPRMGNSFGQGQTQGDNNAQPVPGFVNTPVDVPTLIAGKGYNPANFDVRPGFARYFVIKSYTEDDVHKSLKYEIWSSTDPGNKRLDKAFKECGGRGPIYLFFSVNASGHFCGMAEMLTPVDYTRSSTVWASDKWKGVFKVRWIFVRDIPNANLRHIRLNNTQERKPVTNSRDTQELLPEAGQEMLRIFHTHPARTSLLQDFAFYELQAMQKMQVNQQQHQQGGTSDGPTPPSHSPPPQQAMFSMNMANMANTPAMYGAMPPAMGGALSPHLLSMQMGMGMMSPPFGMQQTQAMHQSVMRHPSPGPPGQNFMGMGSVPY
ncbi:YT521-B-like domain-containing protein [Suillus subalutaceus]|uniref:YT521-B-like domain-containing protein n=1 Tax=Suillus subalutaceus TaxID=48586 RepID=UPI001B882E04|nr:YT521-B-like domain-containing protein [Suillus subalutaceus]KAG1877655.1 YT521-B-like domain-containing protein [Suillus subalutaceus]